MSVPNPSLASRGSRAAAAAAFVVALLAAALLCGACGGGGGSDDKPPSASQTTVDVTPGAGVVANGVDSALITVTVRDAQGKALAWQPVVLAASGQQNTLVPLDDETDATGVVQATLASLTAQTKTITAWVGAAAIQVGAAPTVAFIGDAGALSAALSSATATPSAGVVADGVDAATITVTVRDVNGNAVADQLVEVASSGSDNVLVQPAGPTDAAGVATATLASTRAQTKTLSVVVNPGASQVALADAPTVAFVGDPSTLSAALSSLAAAPGVDVVADGTTTSTLTITVRDAHGNPVAGQTVQVAASGSANTLVQPAVATNSAGVATATLATTVAETKTLSAIVNPGSGDLLLDDAPTVAFIGDASAIDPALSSVDAAPLDDVVANGTDASTVTVTVRDIHGNPVPGQLVELAASGSGNAIAQPASPTDAAGVATAALAATKAEVKTLLATVNPGPGAVALADQPSVEFIADASQISAALSSASATPGAGLVANGTDASTITAVVRDVHGNAVPGQTVAVASSGSGNTLVQPGATTDASGAASATIASTVAELKHVTLTINPGPNQVVLAAQPIAEFVADLSDLSAVLSSVSVAPGTDVIANGSDASSISVTVRDANGNLVAGQIVQLAASGAGNTLVQPASPTNASGIATGSLASTIAGAKTLTVTINPGPAQLVLTSQPDVVFVGDPSAISAALSSASAAPSADVVADGTTSSTITVAVRDVNGNPVAGQVVQLAASGASNTLGQPAAVTNALGVAVGTLASTHAETKTLAITVNPGAGQIVLADAPTVAFVGDPSAISASLSSASAAPSTDVVADGATASTITVTVRDAHGNAVAGQAVQLAASGAGNTLVQPAAVTDAFGVATGTLASTHAEAKTLTATVNPGASQVVLADAPTVAFVGDPSTISASLSSASAVPSSDVVADGATASTITVTVRDVNGNPVAGQVVELAATGTNNTLAQPAVATDALGVAAGTLASTHAEVKTLTVTVNPGAGQVVLADAPTVAFVGDPSTISAALSSASAAPSTDVVADGTTSSTITVTVRDANGNAVAGQTVQLASSGTNNSLAQPAAVTNALGVAVGALASTRAETKTLTVTVNPGAGQVVLADAPAVAFVGDPSTISALLSSASASPSSNVVADGTTSTTITVTVRDANGNAVAGQTVQLASSGTNNTLVQPAAVTNALGVATGTLASTKAETKTLGATVNPGAGQVVLADAPTVGFVGDPSTISAALSSASAAPGSDVVADGTTASTITVTVRDANGNAVAGQTVQLASSGTSNALVQPAAVTNGLGVATGTLASTHAETKALTATVNPGAGQVVLADAPTVAFVGDPSAISAALSSVAAAPGSGIVADGTDAAAITVTVRDVNGNAVAGQTVQLAATGTGNTLVQPAAVTSAAGIATGSLASTVAATKAITAIVNPGAGQVALSDAPTAAFVADASSISAALSSVSASPTSGVAADGSTASTITITVRDANGNAVAGQTVQLAATGTGNSLAQPAAVTNTSGVATGALAATIAETKTLTATVNPGAGQVVLASTPTVVFTGDPNAISAALSTIEADPDFGARANGSDAVTVTVTVRDANGNPVAAQSVQLTATGSGNALSQPASATDLAGQTSGTLKTTIAELKTLTALIDPGGAGIAVAASATAEFVWPAPTRRFVRVTGSDANDGLSAQSAWRTLGMAALSVSAGQTVHVGAGTYAESVVIAGSGTQADPIAFLADETGEYTGDAGEVLVDAQDALAAFTLDSIDDVEVTGFTVTGALAGSGVGFRVGPGTTHRVKLRRNQIYSNGIGIQAQNAIDLLLEHNRISRSRRVIGDIAGSTSDGGHGVVLDGGSSATLRNNLLYANEGSGLWITGGVLGATVQSNTFYANESDQLFVDGLLNVVTLSDNALAAGLADGIELAVGSVALSSYNFSFGNAGSNWLGLALGSGDQAVNPSFVDPDGSDGILGGANAGDDAFQLDTAGPSAAFDAGSLLSELLSFADGSSLADLTSRTDGVLDGTAPDGGTTNVGFHYDASTDALGALVGGDARVVYAEGAQRQPRVRAFDGVASTLSAELSAPPAGATLRWLVHEQSPHDDGEELVAGAWVGASSTGIALRRWSGHAWHADFDADWVASGSASVRSLALAYEGSGDALCVWSDGTANPKFRARHQGEWSDEASVFTLAPGLGAVAWIELASRSGSDEITLVYADALLGLRAVVWNGTSWDTANAAALEIALRSATLRCFDVEYEESSGDALVIWAAPLNAAKYARRAAGATAWTTTSGISGLGTTPSVYDLAAEPGSDRIAMAGLEDAAAGSEPKCGIWTGSAWSSVLRLETGTGVSQAAQVGDLGIAAAWLGTSGTAIAIYADNQSGRIDWGMWTSGAGWVLQSDFAIAGKGTTESVVLAPFPDRNRILALLSDSNSDLYAASFDGTNWTLLGGGALETSVSTIAGAPFACTPRGD